MSTICVIDCDVTVVIVMSQGVYNLLLLPEHVVCFCKQNHVEKWVRHSCLLRMSVSNTVSDRTVINLMFGLIDDWGVPCWGA